MRFDHWSKAEKEMLEFDYKQLFADQVFMLKKIYRFKSDQNLFDDIITNISHILFRLLHENHITFVEELIERMFLSVLPYDVLINQQRNLSIYKFDLYFYDQYQQIDYRHITVKSIEDLKKLIELILYIGRKYDQIALLQQDDLQNLNKYQLILGFDETFIRHNMKHIHQIFYIQ